MKSQYTNLAYLHAKAGKTEALGAALQTLVEPSRADPACLVYDLHLSVEDPDLWFLYEIWRSQGPYAGGGKHDVGRERQGGSEHCSR